MTKKTQFRCKSCGAGMKIEEERETTGISEPVTCLYCGTSFILPDPVAEPEEHRQTFQAGYDVEHDPELAEAINWVHSREEGFTLSDFGTSVSFGIFHINDRGLKIVCKLYNLEILDLHLCNISGSGLKEIQRLTKLRRLDLSHTKIGDRDLTHLVPLRQLEYLNLDLCDVTDRCIDHLEKIPSLEHLDIQTTDITAEGIHRLALLPNIRKLEISPYGSGWFPLYREGIAGKCFDLHNVRLGLEELTDEDLRFLQGMDSIKSLDLRVNKITGPGLKYLSGLKRLMSLKLCLNPITDKYLEHLLQLPRLRVLEIEHTLITKAGVAMLKEKKPKMLIRYK